MRIANGIYKTGAARLIRVKYNLEQISNIFLIILSFKIMTRGPVIDFILADAIGFKQLLQTETLTTF